MSQHGACSSKNNVQPENIKYFYSCLSLSQSIKKNQGLNGYYCYHCLLMVKNTLILLILGLTSIISGIQRIDVRIVSNIHVRGSLT